MAAFWTGDAFPEYNEWAPQALIWVTFLVAAMVEAVDSADSGNRLRACGWKLGEYMMGLIALWLAVMLSWGMQAV